MQLLSPRGSNHETVCLTLDPPQPFGHLNEVQLLKEWQLNTFLRIKLNFKRMYVYFQQRMTIPKNKFGIMTKK